MSDFWGFAICCTNRQVFAQFAVADASRECSLCGAKLPLLMAGEQIRPPFSLYPLPAEPDLTAKEVPLWRSVE